MRHISSTSCTEYHIYLKYNIIPLIRYILSLFTFSEERESFRKIVLVDFLENDDFSKYLDLSGDTTLSDNEMESAVAVLSQSVAKSSEDVVPGLSSNSILPVSGRLPDIVNVKDGVKQICTYDDSLRKNISQDSSDEEIFEINAPKNLLESL